MKWFIGLVFCLALCWMGWNFAPGAMGTWFVIGGLPITGYMVVFLTGIAIVVSAKR